MHRLFVAVLALCLSGNWALAQTKEEPKKDPRQRGQLYPGWRQLGLTQEQIQKIYKIQSEHRAQIEELRAKIEELKKKELAEAYKVLTDAQKLRLKEINDKTPKEPSKDKPPTKDKPTPKDKGN